MTRSFICLLIISWTSSAYSVCEVLNAATFTPPSSSRYFSVQSTLHNQVQLAISQLRTSNTPYKDLRLDTVLENTKRDQAVDVADLKRARRELYRNAEGRDDPRIQDLKRSLETFIEIAETWHLHYTNQFETQFDQNLMSLRKACFEFERTRSRAARRELAQAIGWMKSRDQLPSQIQSLESRFVLPNAYVRIDKTLIDRAIPQDALQTTVSSPVTSQVIAPTGLFGSNQASLFRGTATTNGRISYELVPNNKQAEIKVVFRGTTVTSGVGSSGPVNAPTISRGNLYAETSLMWDGTRFQYSPILTSADMHVQAQTFHGAVQMRPIQQTQLGRRLMPGLSNRVTALRQNMRQRRQMRRNRIVENIAERRAQRPGVIAAVKRQSDAQARANLKEQMEGQLREAVQNLAANQQPNAGKFSKTVAPIVSEDLVPKIHSTQTSSQAIFIGSLSRWRHQLGASRSCDSFMRGDVSVCMHESAFANTISRSWRAKDVDDTFFSEVSSSLLNEVPYDLFIAETSTRWRVNFGDIQPFQVDIDSGDKITVRVYIKSFYRQNSDDSSWQLIDAPTVYEARYALRFDEYGDLYLKRVSDVLISRDNEDESYRFIDLRMTAFLAEDINFGGFSLPEGGVIGTLNKLRVRDYEISKEWVKVGFDIPDELIATIKDQAQKE